MMPEGMERYIEQAQEKIIELEDDSWKLRRKYDAAMGAVHLLAMALKARTIYNNAMDVQSAVQHYFHYSSGEGMWSKKDVEDWKRENELLTKQCTQTIEAALRNPIALAALDEAAQELEPKE